MRSLIPTALAAALALGAAVPTARAQDADLVFWQSIQNSSNPAEYQAYLDAFPNGKFRALALIRLKHPPVPKPTAALPAAAPVAAPPAAPAEAAAPPPAAPCPGIVGDCQNKVIVQPTVGRVGQKFKISFSNFPDPNTDVFMVVPAGTPDFDPVFPPQDMKIIYRTYIYNRGSLTNLVVGPFAPGKYEARYMTKLYNNDNRYETSARTMFSVR